MQSKLANINLVSEFYTNMVYDQFSDSNVFLVQGVAVVVSIDKINSYFELPHAQNVEVTYLNKFILGSELRLKGNVGWNRDKLLRKDLHLETAF